MTRALLAAIVLLLAFHSTASAQPAVRIVRDDSGKAIAFEASSLDEEKLGNLEDAARQELLAVFVLEKGSKDELPNDLPPLLGKHEVREDALRFTPQFPLVPGTRYRAILKPDLLDGRKVDPKHTVVLDIALPAAKPAAAAVVTQVYPTASNLPENLLRFYLHFSQPMTQGEAYSHLSLLKEDGKAVDLPFLELGEELWDRSGTRLTLLIDPGRIKRGLKPREDVGPVLEAGKSYTLVVDAAWKDAAGTPLKAEHRKRFKVGPPVETGIDTATWKIGSPAAGSREPLVVRFPRPLDHALLMRTFQLKGDSEKVLAGKVEIGNEEREWRFVPDDNWGRGKYTLEIDKVLEDPVGNRIGRPFELGEGETARQTGPATAKLRFSTVIKAGR